MMIETLLILTLNTAGADVSIENLGVFHYSYRLGVGVGGGGWLRVSQNMTHYDRQGGRTTEYDI